MPRSGPDEAEQEVKGIAAVAAFLLALVGSVVLGTGGAQSACGATVADVSAAATHPSIAGYSGDQLANAAVIMNAGAAAGLDVQGQILGVMTAMGESSLRNLTYGDTVGPDSLGLFQQRAPWGSVSDRLDPATAAMLFFRQLVQVPGWRQMPPTSAAHAVQHNADPEHYSGYLDAAQAVVAGLIGPDPACAVGITTDEKTLARNLVAAIDAGTVTGGIPDPTTQIRAIANGTASPDCGIDTRILQVITIAYATFGKIGISSINRKCTGQILGAGAASAHYANGGGHAVDFYSLGGTATTGADANAIKLLRSIDHVMPDGSAAGQADCRTNRGAAITLAHLRQFNDYCTHLHIEVPTHSTAPLQTT